MIIRLKSLIFTAILTLFGASQIIFAANVKRLTVNNFGSIKESILAFVKTGDKAACFWDIDDTLGFYDIDFDLLLPYEKTSLHTQFLLGTDKGFGVVSNYLKENDVQQNPLKLMFGAVVTAHASLSQFFKLTEGKKVTNTMDVFERIGIFNFALTSRSWPIISITEAQLERVGIHFSKPKDLGVNASVWPLSVLNSGTPWKAFLTPAGTIHCSGNNKGVILENWLQILLGNSLNLMKIIVVDNDNLHLDKIEQIFTNSKLAKEVLLINYNNSKVESRRFELDYTTKAWLDLVISLERPSCVTSYATPAFTPSQLNAPNTQILALSQKAISLARVGAICGAANSGHRAMSCPLPDTQN